MMTKLVIDLLVGVSESSKYVGIPKIHVYFIITSGTQIQIDYNVKLSFSVVE